MNLVGVSWSRYHKGTTRGLRRCEDVASGAFACQVPIETVKVGGKHTGRCPGRGRSPRPPPGMRVESAGGCGGRRVPPPLGVRAWAGGSVGGRFGASRLRAWQGEREGAGRPLAGGAAARASEASGKPRASRYSGAAPIAAARSAAERAPDRDRGARKRSDRSTAKAREAKRTEPSRRGAQRSERDASTAEGRAGRNRASGAKARGWERRPRRSEAQPQAQRRWKST